jgi:flagellar L-ring protein precursor FlgH
MASVSAPIANQSWYEIPLPPAKEVKVHDIITIRVDTGARTSESAQLQRRRTSQIDAILNDFIVLEGLRAIRPAPQSEGNQRVQGNLNQLNRVTGQLDTAESLKFEIAATVSAVLPNGNIVLEAHRVIESNNEQWMHSLSGVCRREDIGPNNVVLSKDIANLRVKKAELGQIRDSYKRGWLTRWWDQFGPF